VELEMIVMMDKLLRCIESDVLQAKGRYKLPSPFLFKIRHKLRKEKHPTMPIVELGRSAIKWFPQQMTQQF